MKDEFCSHCGCSFDYSTLVSAEFPRKCSACGEETWKNIWPVAVVIIPVADGVLAIRRGEDPGKGKLALPGGYLEAGETWQQGSAREIKEEVGLDIAPEDLRLFDLISTANDMLVVLSVAPALAHAPNEVINLREVQEHVVLTEPVELAFPSHTAALKKFFEQHHKQKP